MWHIRLVIRLAHKYFLSQVLKTRKTKREARGGARAHHRNWKREAKDFLESLVTHGSFVSMWLPLSTL